MVGSPRGSGKLNVNLEQADWKEIDTRYDKGQLIKNEATVRDTENPPQGPEEALPHRWRRESQYGLDYH